MGNFKSSEIWTSSVIYIGEDDSILVTGLDGKLGVIKLMM
jgi:hypothetical protein